MDVWNSSIHHWIILEVNVDRYCMAHLFFGGQSVLFVAASDLIYV